LERSAAPLPSAASDAGGAATASESDSGGSLGGFSAFSGGGFDFSKMLDDLPGGDTSAEGEGDSPA
jgi:hypothetical protein